MPRPSADLMQKLASLLGEKGFTSNPFDMEPWLTDWRGQYHGAAAAMLSPETTGEMAEIVRLTARERVPLVPQGGNSSMAGGATPDDSGDALILSTRRMNRIRAMDAPGGTAICEAGVILADLHSAAIAAGRRFPLTLGAKGSATIGGLVSTNAGGTQVLRFGTMRSLVLGLEAVLPDGSVFSDLKPLKKDNRGYSLTQLLIGAEGTIGIVTAASLKLVPLPAGRSVAWIGLASPQMALSLLDFLEERLPGAIESFELIPRSSLDLVVRHLPGVRPPLDRPHDWNVLVEAAHGGEGEAEAELMSALADALERGLADDAVPAANESQAEAFWRIRDGISEAEKKDGPAAKHDISVPVRDMPDFIPAAAAAVERRFPGVRVNAFGHLGDGNVHFNVRAPAGAGPEWLTSNETAVNQYVYDLTTTANGSISAEHGIGQVKLRELERLAGPARLKGLRAIKLAFDPDGIMNPGKLVPLAENGVHS